MYQERDSFTTPSQASQPELVQNPAATSLSQIEDALAILQAHKEAWVQLGISERLVILEELLHDVIGVADRWVVASLTAKRFTSHTLAEAEEWLFLAIIARALRLLHQSLVEIREHGRPHIPGPIKQLANGQIAVQVIPQSWRDRILFHGISGEVWMEPGVTREEMIGGQAWSYRNQHHADAGKVCLVLGAGNASMLAVIDVLHKLFVEDQVVVLKPNPVNAYLGPLIEAGFQALTRRGFLRIVYGGVQEGSCLCRHPSVDELHLTGSVQTFEAITFGGGDEGLRRKLARTPLTAKRFSCELGNISPVIIVPGPWEAADLQEQAEQIATWLVANAGFGCLTPRVIIQHRAWPLRTALVNAIGRVLDKVPTRNAYYPGAKEIHAAFVASHSDVYQFGGAGGDELPWTFITGVDSHKANDLCFTSEAFCGILAETALDGADAGDFIDRAVSFANGTLWGTLNATLIVHPTSLKDPRVAGAVERAIAHLRYGTVLVNMAAFAGYYFLVTPWGGFPGHDIDDIQSGVGKTANFLMFERAQKSVIRGPFRKRLDSIRVTAKHAHEFGRQLAYFEASPSVSQAARLIWSALRG